MYVTAEIIREVERRYGTPVEIAREYEMTPEQFDIVRLGTKHGRCHDVTLVIVDDERNIVVTRKPSYPAGAFRAPSGGIEPGESFDDGAIREAKEETGLDIVLEKYLIRANVRFRRLGFHPDQRGQEGERGRDGVPTYEDVIDWTTHVLQARPTGGTLQPLDTKEIVEARKATIPEITGPIREALIASGSPGLRYRAELDGLAMELVWKRTMVQAIRLQTKSITDWDSFHSVFAETLGFPGFYGRNLDAWIDCMTYLDDEAAAMTKTTVAPGETFRLEISDAADFQRRVPEIFQAFIECAAFVNWRRVEKGDPPVLALVLL